MACEKCIWWKQDGCIAGDCRKRAPIFMDNDPGNGSKRAWPITLDRDDCGEFENKYLHNNYEFDRNFPENIKES